MATANSPGRAGVAIQSGPSRLGGDTPPQAPWLPPESQEHPAQPNLIVRDPAARRTLIRSGALLGSRSSALLGSTGAFQQICLSLDLGCTDMPASMFAAIQQNLAAQSADRVPPILVLTVAHLLTDDTFSTLHAFANESV